MFKFGSSTNSFLMPYNTCFIINAFSNPILLKEKSICPKSQS